MLLQTKATRGEAIASLKIFDNDVETAVSAIKAMDRVMMYN